MNSPKVIFTTSLFFLLIMVTSNLLADQKEVAASNISIPFEITRSGHQVATFIYDGKPIRMILDTAAGANVFSQKSAKKLKLNMKDSKNKASGLGTQSHPMLEVFPIIISWEKNQLKLSDIVSLDLSHIEAAGGIEGVDGLLGSPFFRANKAQIDFSTNMLILKGGKNHVE